MSRRHLRADELPTRKCLRLIGFVVYQYSRRAHGIGESTSRVSLYKVLLAQHVADALKSGRLNLPASFQYRPFDAYLLPLATWLTDRNGLLEQANLTHLNDCNTVSAKLKEELMILHRYAPVNGVSKNRSYTYRRRAHFAYRALCIARGD